MCHGTVASHGSLSPGHPQFVERGLAGVLQQREHLDQLGSATAEVGEQLRVSLAEQHFGFVVHPLAELGEAHEVRATISWIAQAGNVLATLQAAQRVEHRRDRHPEMAGKVGRRCRLRFAQRAVERVATGVERRISQCFGEERTDSLRRSEEEVHRGERPWGWQASGHVVNRRGRTSRGPRRAPSPSPFGQLQPLVLPQLGQAWQLPARFICTPHCMHIGASL